MFGPVACHRFSHVFKQLLSISGFRHVDVVDHDNTAHITETKLTCNFVGGGCVYVDSCFLLGVAPFGTVAAVHIYHVHGLGMLDNQVSSTFIRNRTSKQRFNLFRDTEIVEDR